jgi:phosphoadenosine phosphosulfate reductase
MLGQLDIYGRDKVQLAIERLQSYEPDEGYFLAFSGGKDSVVIKALADMAGVKYDAHYNITTVDPPELVHFVKSFDDIHIDAQTYEDGRRITMWNLIPKKLMPPTRIARYCCQYLKETNGYGRVTVTGVRWAESVNRRKNQGEMTIFSKSAAKELDKAGIQYTKTQRGGIVLNLDNADSRDAMEMCYRTRKTLINPIVDWDDDDVWEFIHKYNIPYCKLYDEGYKRLGCIGCPISSTKHRLSEFERYPKFKRQYLKAFEKMLNRIKEAGYVTTWESADDVFNWWMEISK